MRVMIRPVALVVLGLTPVLFVACGGGKPAETPVGGASTGAPTASASSPTTTTDLQDAGAGVKLEATGTPAPTSTGPTPFPGDGGSRSAGEPGRSKDDIRNIVNDRRPEARACYDAALKSHPGIQGNIVVKWVIDPKGNVTDISVDPSGTTIHEESVGTCIIGVIKKIKFNESAKRLETHATYPFNFKPGSVQAQ